MVQAWLKYTHKTHSARDVLYSIDGSHQGRLSMQPGQKKSVGESGAGVEMTTRADDKVAVRATFGSTHGVWIWSKNQKSCAVKGLFGSDRLCVHLLADRAKRMPNDGRGMKHWLARQGMYHQTAVHQMSLGGSKEDGEEGSKVLSLFDKAVGHQMVASSKLTGVQLQLRVNSGLS